MCVNGEGECALPEPQRAPIHRDDEAAGDEVHRHPGGPDGSGEIGLTVQNFIDPPNR